MVQQNVQINVIAQDNASVKLDHIGQVAAQVAVQLNKAGTDGEKGLKKIEDAATKADSRMRMIERTFLAVGAAAGTVALATVKASFAYQQQERQIDAIGRMYGRASSDVLEFAESIQLTTRYSNDAARQSLVLLNTLQQNYGITGAQIETLMFRITDLAQMHGKSMTEVTQMVQNALRGEAEYIEQLGVTLNQTFVAQEAAARGMGNFISEMNAAEQAAFRFQLLMEQTASAQGAAAAAMDGTRGTVSYLINEFGDLTQMAGRAIGPVRDLAAEFNNYALWLPLVASQLGRVGAILANSQKTFDIYARSMHIASMALSGWGLAGMAAAGVGALLLHTWVQNKQEAAQLAAEAKQLEAAMDSLHTTINSLYSSGQVEAAKWAATQINALDQFRAVWNETAKEMQKSFEKEQDESGPWFWNLPVLNDIDNFMSSMSTGIQNLAPESWFGDIDKANKDKKKFLESLSITDAEGAEIASSFQRFISLSNNPYIDQDEMQAEWEGFMADLWEGVENEDIDPSFIDDYIDAMSDRWERKAAEAAEKIKESNKLILEAFQLHDMELDGWLQSDIDNFARFQELTKAREDFIAYQNSLTQGNSTNPDAGASGKLDLTHWRLSAEQLEAMNLFNERINDALLSGEYNNDAIIDRYEAITDMFMRGRITADEYVEAIGQLATNFDDFGSNTDMVSHKLGKIDDLMRRSLATKTADVRITEEQAKAYMKLKEAREREEKDTFLQGVGTGLIGGAVDVAGQAIEAQKELLEKQKDFISEYRELIGMGDALGSVNMTSLRSESSMLAGDFAMANTQLNNMFRIIVGNTDAIKSQADSVLTWITGLTQANEDGAVRISELLDKGLINDSQFAAAQEAYTSIADSTIRIKDNLDAVQAIQAPLIADSMEWQAQLTEQLLGQDAATQRLTLAWADADSAAQAFSLTQQLIAMQQGELGDVSAETMHTIIQGAITANPLLFDMLESMGIISGTPLDFQVNTDALEGAKSEFDRLAESIDHLVTTLREIYDLPPLEVDTGDIDTELDNATSATDKLKAGVEAMRKALEDPLSIDIEFGPEGDMGGLGTKLGDLVRNFSGQGGGDGTGGATTIPVQIVPELEDGELALPEPPPMEVKVETDMTDLATKMAAESGKEVSGPTFKFVGESTQISAAAQVWAAAQITGPQFIFQSESSYVTAAALVWQSAQITGPMFNFQANSADVTMEALVWQAATINGPTFAFQPDSTAVTAAALVWSGAVINGPLFKFVADDSGVANVIARYSDGAVIATQYINIVARTLGNPFGFGFRHGGTAGYAHGGIVGFRAGEGDNPEVLRTPNGRQGIIPNDGIYFAPRGSQVSPSNIHRGNLGNVSVSITGNTFYGGSRPDLDEWAADVLIPAFADEGRRNRSAQGR